MRLNSYYISKCNYKAFNRLCWPGRLTLWDHAQIRKCSVQSKFFQWQRARNRHSLLQRRAMVEGGRGENTEQTREGPWGAPSLLCSFTHLLWVSTKCITTEWWGVCAVFLQDAGHTNTRGGCDHKLLKSTKSTFAAKIFYFFHKPIETDINMLTVCPCQA